ncbi:MAG: UDP-3-O-(3-hydroxymyristoyl)glucosamine N-acyltransferase [Gammaproteobacteria bacterium]|nr:UDP-3-O-(3-hydroxymyristoyl)glucosamine N-acyltransferase [Gammaproteobacteria bacterium]
MPIRLSDLAVKLACRLRGEDCLIDNVADINQAQRGQLVFVYNPKYLDQLKSSKASAVIIRPEWVDSCEKSALLSDNPRLSFAKAAWLLNPLKTAAQGVAASAVVDTSVTVPASASIGHNVVIQAGVVLGENVQIGAGTVIDENVSIGDHTVIYPNVSIGHDIQIGSNCVIYSGAVIGTDGFGYVMDEGGYLKVPQLGSVRIGDNVDIGANTAIDRGSLSDTVISDGVKLDNHIQIAHNVVLGKNTIISGLSGLSGSSIIGENCIIGGGVGIRDNIEVADNVMITGRTFVSSSLKQAGSYSSSVLVDTTKNWRKNAIHFKHLDDMAKRIKHLEKQLENLAHDD